MPKLPLCIIAGMPRSGTTFLYHYLQKHPSIYVPFRKESDFFGVNYARGEDWYRSLFKGKSAEQLACDISPLYVTDPETVKRIKAFDADVKVILAVRDLPDFSLSLYAQLKTIHRSVPPFEEFLDHYNMPKGDSHYKLRLSSGQIIEGIETYRKAMGDNLLIYSYDLFKKDPLFVLNSIEAFLKIPVFFTESNFKNIIINTHARKSSKLFTQVISQEAIIKLIERFIPRRVTLFGYNLLFLLEKPKGKAGESSFPDDLVQLAQDTFRADQSYVEDLFRAAKMQLGSGDPFTS